MPEPASYILKIHRDELEERQLFSRRAFHVSVRRDWSRGTKVLFVRKDAFVGSGVIDRFVGIDGLEEPEKKLCLENNWYGKIVFAMLARFHPPVPVQDTPAAGQNPLALHGASMSSSDVLQIEKSAAARIIS
ncbi:MAG TPA: hypothetical protein VFS46_08080 [Nitrososphaera sp.]|nr:hypothetical protein [Nitrososphaera sp.]